MQVIGAAWYLLSLDRVITCWRSQCKLEDGMNGPLCQPEFFYCDHFNQPDLLRWSNVTNVFKNCDPDGGIFNYGIFKIALTNDIFGTHFSKKYFYCLWWGFQNLRYVLYVPHENKQCLHVCVSLVRIYFGGLEFSSLFHFS